MNNNGIFNYEKFFLSINREEVLTSIIKFVENRQGIFVLTGENGVGKTTLTTHLSKCIKNTKAIIIRKIYLNEEDFLRDICKHFEVENTESSIVELLLNKLELKLKSYYKEHTNVLLIIDNIDEFDVNILDTIIKINEPEYEGNKLIQIMLVLNYKGIEIIKQKEQEYEEQLFNFIFDIKNFNFQETKQFIKELFKENNIVPIDDYDIEYNLFFEATKGNAGEIIRLIENIFLSNNLKKLPNKKQIIQSIKELGLEYTEVNKTTKNNNKLIPIIIGIVIVLALIFLFIPSKKQKIQTSKKTIENKAVTKDSKITTIIDNTSKKQIIKDNNTDNKVAINKEIQTDNISKNINLKDNISEKISDNQTNEKAIDNTTDVQIVSNKSCVKLIKNLNFRVSPDLNAQRITVLMNNTRYEILQETEKWLKIKYQNQEGWIYKSPNFVNIYPCDKEY